MAAAPGYGLKFGIKSGGTYPDLTDVIEFTPNNATKTAIETTHFQSSNRTREFIGGLIDQGEYSVVLHYTPATSDAIFTAFATSANSEVQLTWPNGIREQAAGVITSRPRTAPIDDRMTIGFTLKISGTPTLLAAA